METKNGTVIGQLDDVALYERYLPHLTTIERVNYPIWALVGIPGGLFSIYIWSSRSMRHGGSGAAAIYQASVGFVDVSFLLIRMIFYLHISWDIAVLNRPVLCEFYPILSYLIQYLSPMLTLIFTMERYLAVCHPFTSQHWLIRASDLRSLWLVLILTVLCLLLASVQGVIFVYDGSLCTTRAFTEPGQKGHKLFTTWTYFTECLFFFCMPVTCLILNIFVIRILWTTTKQKKLGHLKEQKCTPSSESVDGQTNLLDGNQEQKRQREIHTTQSLIKSRTMTLLCTSFYTLVAHLSVSIVFVMNAGLRKGNPDLTLSDAAHDVGWKTYFTFQTIRALIEAFSMTQYAVKFIIYLITSQQFRKEFRKIFIKKVIPPMSMGGGTRESLLPSVPPVRLSVFLFGQSNVKESDRRGPRPRPSPGLTRKVLNAEGERV